MFYLQVMREISGHAIQGELLTVSEAKKRKLIGSDVAIPVAFQMHREAIMNNMRLVELSKNEIYFSFGVRFPGSGVRFQYFEGYWWKRKPL